MRVTYTKVFLLSAFKFTCWSPHLSKPAPSQHSEDDKPGSTPKDGFRVLGFGFISYKPKPAILGGFWK